MLAFEQVACIRPKEPRGLAGIKAPFRFLTAMSGLGWYNYGVVLLTGWVLLLVIGLIVYFALPLGFWNSYNGFKNAWVSVGFALLIFFILVFTYVVLTRDSQCERLDKRRRQLEAGDVFIPGASAALTSDAVASGIAEPYLVRLGTYSGI